MGITVAVGVVAGPETVAGVTIGRILALGVDLLPGAGPAATLLGVATRGVGLILAVGGSDEHELYNILKKVYRKKIARHNESIIKK